MTWKPSNGLRGAEPVVQDLLQAAAAVGKHITDPVLRYRFTEIVATALDNAMAVGAEQASQPDLPDFPPSPGDELPYTNGHHEVERWTPFDVPTSAGPQLDPRTFTTIELRPDPNDPNGILAVPVTAPVAEEPARTPQKRGRGRPKGSLGKKKKAARAKPKAQEEAKPEAPAVETPNS